MSGSYDPDALVVIRAIAHLGGGAEALRHARGRRLDGAPIRCPPRAAGEISCSSPASRGWTRPASRSRRGTTPTGSRLAYERAAECLEAAGGSMDDVIDICSFHLDPRGMVPVRARAHGRRGRGSSRRRRVVDRDRHARAVRPRDDVAVPLHRRPSAAAAHRPRVGEHPLEGHAERGREPQGGRDADRHRGRGGVGRRGQRDDARRHARPGALRVPRGSARSSSCTAHTWTSVVEITSFHKDPRASEIVMEAGRTYFEPGHGPAWTAVADRAVEPGIPARDLRAGGPVSSPRGACRRPRVRGAADAALERGGPGCARRALAEAGRGMDDVVGCCRSTPTCGGSTAPSPSRPAPRAPRRRPGLP